MNSTITRCLCRFVGKLFHHVLEDPESKSTVVHALSVCISLLDPKRAATIAAAGAARGQHVTEPVLTANPDTVEGMLQRLGRFLSSSSVLFICLPKPVATNQSVVSPCLTIVRAFCGCLCSSSFLSMFFLFAACMHLHAYQLAWFACGT